MNRTIKGALAASAAGVLLLGGAGTLAYWTDTSTADGGTFSSGELDLAAPDCDGLNDGTPNTEVWKLDGGATFVAQKLVPGDTLTKVCYIDVTAAGTHLGADLTVETPTWNAAGDEDLTDELVVTGTFVVGGSTVTSITEAADTLSNGNGELEVTIEVEFPIGTEDNTTNIPGGLDAILDDIVVTATQDHDAT